jgi:uncharacterized protein DUF4339
MNISISRDSVEIGEWTEDEVRALYKDGHLVATDYYWKEGMSEWAELSKMIKPAPPVPKTLPVDNQPAPHTTSANDKRIGLNPRMVQAAALVVALMAMGFGKAAVKAYPDAAWLIASGAVCGLLIGIIPYCIARFAYKSKQFTLYLWIGAAIGAVAGLAYWPLYFDGQLEEICHQQNKMLPTMVTSALRADSISMEAGRVVRCQYTIIDSTTTTVDPVQFKQLARPELIELYRTMPSLKLFRNNGVTVIFDFFTDNGAHYATVEISPGDLDVAPEVNPVVAPTPQTQSSATPAVDPAVTPIPAAQPATSTPPEAQQPPSWPQVEASPQYRESTPQVNAVVFKRWVAQGQAYLNSLKGATPQDDQKAQQQFSTQAAAIGADKFHVRMLQDANGRLITIGQEAAMRGVTPESLYQNQYDTPDLPYTIPLQP